MNAIARAVTLCLVAALASGCAKTKNPDPGPAPPPTYRGPEFLQGTIGSLATLKGYNPVLVSGYGLVVNLDGTGSADVPPVLRERFMDELAKRGFGSSETGFRNLPPAEVLNSDRTAIVKIEGVIPPGATKGTFFDLKVTALSATQTTSLAGGLLYTTELAIGGADLTAPSDLPLARGRGPIFLNPFAESSSDTLKLQREGRVMAGGVLSVDAPLQLVLTRPSFRMSRLVADRINGRFPKRSGDKAPLANPLSDSLIAISIPERHKDNPQEILDLISHLFLNPTAEFANDAAQELATIARNPASQSYADSIAYAWQGMGKTILPVLRELYEDDHHPAALAALQAGARLGDTGAAEPLFKIASGQHGSYSERATVLLGEMQKLRMDNVRVMMMLRKLIDADDPYVRLAAFDALANVDDTTVRRFGFARKCEIAQVSSNKPMIFVAREGKPRIVIFDDRLGLGDELLFSAFDGKFMLRRNPGDAKVAVYHRGPGTTRAQQEELPPNLAYLAGVMAYQPNEDSDTPGLDMPYSSIVKVLYELTEQKIVDAPFVLQRSRLEDTIARTRIITRPEVRPDSGEDSDAEDTNEAPTARADNDS